MSPRPIDMKSMIPRTQQLSIIKQNENNMSRNALKNQMNKTNIETEKKLKQVNDSEKTQHKKISKDDQNKNRKNHNQNRKDDDSQSDDEEREKKNERTLIGRNIDIKI